MEHSDWQISHFFTDHQSALIQLVASCRRTKSFYWAKDDLGHCRLMASLCHIELNTWVRKFQFLHMANAIEQLKSVDMFQVFSNNIYMDSKRDYGNNYNLNIIWGLVDGNDYRKNNPLAIILPVCYCQASLKQKGRYHSLFFFETT